LHRPSLRRYREIVYFVSSKHTTLGPIVKELVYHYKIILLSFSCTMKMYCRKPLASRHSFILNKALTFGELFLHEFTF
jgi:hypothetical protein